MTGPDWHLRDEELRRYVGGAASPPWRWSTEAHLAACERCRERLADGAPELTSPAWERLDATIDAPTPGPVEALLVRCGVREHTARLLAATPALRLSWLTAIGLTLAFAAGAAQLARSMAAPVPFLAIAPLLPLVGVAISFGPGVDPTYELSLVAPLHTFRLLLLRCVAVVSTTTALTVAVGFALPGYGPVVLAWLLPALALTLLCLVLLPRWGAIRAAAMVGLGWAGLLVATVHLDSGRSALFTASGQIALAAAAVVAGGLLIRVRHDFETDRHRALRPRLRNGRVT